MMNKEMRQLIRRAKKEGAEVLPSAKKNGGHLRLRVNEQVIVLPSTPSDHRAIKNSIATLRRAGLVLR